MEDLNKSFDKKYRYNAKELRLEHKVAVYDEDEKFEKFVWAALVPEEIKSFIRQREKDLLARVREVVGENEVCPCEKLDCPIRRINQFREELIKKLYPGTIK